MSVSDLSAQGMVYVGNDGGKGAYFFCLLLSGASNSMRGKNVSLLAEDSNACPTLLLHFFGEGFCGEDLE